jgi:hypothetical protein
MTICFHLALRSIICTNLHPCPTAWHWSCYLYLLTFDHLLYLTVEQLLQETNLTVCVFTGQLDLIVDTPGELVSSLTGQVIDYSNSTCLWSSWPSIAFSSFYSHLPKMKIL